MPNIRFLLAQLHLDSLSDKTTENKLRATLEILPTGPDALGHAYKKAVERIKSQKEGFRHLAERVILWLACAKRQLTTNEMLHALAVRPGASAFDSGDIEDPTEITLCMRWACCC